MIKKIGCLSVMLIIVGFIVGGLFVNGSISVGKGTNPPSISKAPYIVMTPSRTYYAKEYDGGRLIRGYWEFSQKDNKWIYHNTSIVFDSAWGNVRIERRTQG